MSLLDNLSQLEEDAGLTDIARICALDKATARRMLVELEKFGFVEQIPRRASTGSVRHRSAWRASAKAVFHSCALPLPS